MYINKYDTLIFSELDRIFSVVEKDINIKSILKNLENIEKVFNIKLFKDLVQDSDKVLIDKFIYITKKIFINYLICLLLNFNPDKEKEIKTEVIKLNLYKSDELGNVFNLNNDIINLKIVANEIDREKLVRSINISCRKRIAAQTRKKKQGPMEVRFLLSHRFGSSACDQLTSHSDKLSLL